MKTTMFRSLCAATVLAFGVSANAGVIINEIHYDNTGGDVGEFIEIITTAGEDPAEITVSLYNGSDDELYGNGADTFLLSSFVDHGVLADGNNYYSLTLPSNGLQNGSPDGIAVDLNGVVEDFISYEGELGPAGDGPAIGLTSTDIGVSQSSATPVGSSLQLDRFLGVWVVTNGENTQGALNIPEPGSVVLVLLGSTLAGAVRMRRTLG